MYPKIRKIVVTWRQGKGYNRIPIATVKKNESEGMTFRYLPDGVELAKKNGFVCYPDFTDTNKIYSLNMQQILSHRLNSPARPDIEKYYEEGDWADYTIKVHALKSSAKLIGALEFANEAQLLENAGKEGDEAYIRQNHGAFMSAYGDFESVLSPVFGEPEEKILHRIGIGPCSDGVFMHPRDRRCRHVQALDINLPTCEDSGHLIQHTCYILRMYDNRI